MSTSTREATDTAVGSSLTLAEAADRLGVHYMTAYRYVRLGRLEAHKVGNVWLVPLSSVEAFASEPSARPLATTDAVDALVDAMVIGDEDEAWSVIEPILRTAPSAETIHLDVIGPAMARIGDEWAAGQRSIADEHRATTVARRLLGRVRPSFRNPGRRRGVVVVASPTGDNHSLPSSMFADLVRANGPDVIDLGAETPTETLLEVADRFDGRLVICLTVTHEAGRQHAASSAAVIAERFPEAIVLIGGRAVHDRDDATAMGSTTWSPDPSEAAARAAEFAAQLAA